MAQARQQDRLERRAGELLRRLDLERSYGDEKRLSIWVLGDKTTANPVSTLEKNGLVWADGAPQYKINERVRVDLLGVKKLDRETFRDYVLLPLREVGLLEPAWIPGAKDRKADPKLPLVQHGFWKSKDPRSSYVLTKEAEKLLLDTPDEKWSEQLDTFLKGSDRRRERAKQQAASLAVTTANATSKHSTLIAAAAKAHERSSLLDGYTLLYIDDGDGDRIKEPYASKLKDAGLELNLDTRYPDTIFAHSQKKELWIIDAVASDGEVDPVRLAEITTWAKDAGWTLVGATTAYETLAAYARRQKKMTNIASGTYVWIAELGGQALHVESLA
jgi:hypothetical protein